MTRVLILSACVAALTGCSLINMKGGQLSLNTKQAANVAADKSGSSKRLVDCPLVGDPGPVQAPSAAEAEIVRNGEKYWTGKMPNTEFALKRLDYMAVTAKELDEGPTKYKGYWCSYEREQQLKSLHEREFAETRAAYDQFAAWIKSDEAKAAPAGLDKTIEEAKKLLAANLSGSTRKDPSGDDVTSSSSRVNRLLDEDAKYYTRVLEIAHGAESPEAKAAHEKVAGAKAHYEQVVAELTEKLTEQFRLAAEKYPGKDKEKARKELLTLLSENGKKITRLVLVSDWRRSTGARIVNDHIQSYDHSYITVHVVVPLDKTIAEVWEYIPRRDHIDGDKLKDDHYIGRRIGKMKLANLDKK